GTLALASYSTPSPDASGRIGSTDPRYRVARRPSTGFDSYASISRRGRKLQLSARTPYHRANVESAMADAGGRARGERGNRRGADDRPGAGRRRASGGRSAVQAGPRPHDGRSFRRGVPEAGRERAARSRDRDPPQ